jgi:hypothetical protein
MAKKQKGYGTGIPRHEIEALARALLPTMQAMYEDESIQKEFAEWKAKREEGSKTKRTERAVK